MEIKHFGLIGRRLGHSFSQEWFSRKFAELGLKEYSYELFELPSVDGLKEWALRMGLSGFNVTVPYKLAVIPQLDELDEVAASVGAVNCVTIENERLIGHNTDAPAFQQTLDEGERKAFVMGTGGAARAVAYALEQRNIDYKFYGKNARRGAELGECAFVDLWGMSRDIITALGKDALAVYADGTHTDNYGAYLFSLGIIQAIKDLGLGLSQHILPDTPAFDAKNPKPLLKDFTCPIEPRRTARRPAATSSNGQTEFGPL